MRFLIYVLFILPFCAQAKDSVCESKLVRRPQEFQAMARQILKLPWQGDRKPGLIGLSSNLQFRNLSWKEANAFESGRMVNFFEIAPKMGWPTEGRTADGHGLRLRWSGSGEELLVRISNRMTADDLKLIEESKIENSYREVGQFRYHYHDKNGQERYRGSKFLYGSSHFLSFGGPLWQIAREICQGIAALQTKGIRVESVEIVHTHHQDSFVIKSGAVEKLYYAPLSVRGPRSDLNAARSIAQGVPVPFGVTAILGLETVDLTKMSYWPSDESASATPPLR